MNPQAIMTPGGIADQFTRGLSGVAQAFAQRSQIDRQAQQDAFSQQRALEQDRMARDAFTRQGDWHSADERQQAAEFKLRQDAALRAKDAFDLSQIQANPDAYPNHPVAQRLIQERNRTDQLNQFKTGALGMPLFGTPDVPVGSYIPEDKQAQVAGYNTYTAAQALAREKIHSPKMIWGEDPVTGETVRIPDAPGVTKPAPVNRPPTAAAGIALKLKIDAALAKEEKKLQLDAEEAFPDHNYGMWQNNEDIAAQADVENKRKQFVANAIAKKREELLKGMTLDESPTRGKVTPSASSAVGGSDPLADAWNTTK